MENYKSYLAVLLLSSLAFACMPNGKASHVTEVQRTGLATMEELVAKLDRVHEAQKTQSIQIMEIKKHAMDAHKKADIAMKHSEMMMKKMEKMESNNAVMQSMKKVMSKMMGKK